jgi:transposase
MTDDEWAALAPLLTANRGRPARDARRLWDGIFWVACSRGPWREMPAAFGRADTAHRALRRAAMGLRLHDLLLHVSSHPLMRDSGLHGLAWFIARAFRRAFRVAPAAIAYARRLGFLDALPAAPCWLPRPGLSEWLRRIVPTLPQTLGLPALRTIFFLHRLSGGDPRRWRATG